MCFLLFIFFTPGLFTSKSTLQPCKQTDCIKLQTDLNGTRRLVGARARVCVLQDSCPVLFIHTEVISLRRARAPLIRARVYRRTAHATSYMQLGGTFILNPTPRALTPIHTFSSQSLSLDPDPPLLKFAHNS